MHTFSAANSLKLKKILEIVDFIKPQDSLFIKKNKLHANSKCKTKEIFCQNFDWVKQEAI